MSTLLPLPVHPRLVRAAQRALLNDTANQLSARVREVLCEPTRALIVRALSTGPLCVQDIGLTLGRRRTTISKHLRVLLDEDVVATRRSGRFVYYSVTSELAAQTALGVLEMFSRAAERRPE
ncbi:MAG TPA: metalloregulator ArsR/SmtB family transcription factor [Chloroflexota bacterium]|jgi:ArsR family transcriptional regulator